MVVRSVNLIQSSLFFLTDVDDFSEVFTFDSRENNRMCSSVPIKDNDIIEAPTEMFSVTLNSSDPYVVINRGIALVSIVDDDCKF